MNRDDRITLGTIVKFLTEFEAHSPEATVRHLITLFTVAMEPGTTVTELARRSNSTVASSSRHVRAMALRAAPGKALLTMGFTDGRSKAVMLTDNGMGLVMMLTKRLQHVPEVQNASEVQP